MTHSEPRTGWVGGGAIAFGVGVLYGTSYVVVAHPFDTLKTKMQAQQGFERISMMKTLSKTFRADGIRGLYRGWLPPLTGSAIFRSLQFAIFEAAYTAMDTPFGKSEIPMTAGLQVRVIAGGVLSGTCRAILEAPLEYAKLKQQLREPWKYTQMYTGFGSLLTRCVPLLTSYFIIVDSMRRNRPNWFTYPIFGPFLTSGGAATLAWWTVWPLEYVRTQLQAGYGEKESTLRRLGRLFSKGGFFGLYRGILPGSQRAFIGAGVGMVVMQWAQRKCTEMGFRDQSKK